jgi:hypothetical protein
VLLIVKSHKSLFNDRGKKTNLKGPLYRHTIQGSSTAVEKDYHPTPGDEVEDLYVLLKKIKVSFVH